MDSQMYITQGGGEGWDQEGRWVCGVFCWGTKNNPIRAGVVETA